MPSKDKFAHENKAQLCGEQGQHGDGDRIKWNTGRKFRRSPGPDPASGNPGWDSVTGRLELPKLANRDHGKPEDWTS